MRALLPTVLLIVAGCLGSLDPQEVQTRRDAMDGGAGGGIATGGSVCNVPLCAVLGDSCVDDLCTCGAGAACFNGQICDAGTCQLLAASVGGGDGATGGGSGSASGGGSATGGGGGFSTGGGGGFSTGGGGGFSTGGGGFSTGGGGGFSTGGGGGFSTGGGGGLSTGGGGGISTGGGGGFSTGGGGGFSTGGGGGFSTGGGGGFSTGGGGGFSTGGGGGFSTGGGGGFSTGGGGGSSTGGGGGSSSGGGVGTITGGGGGFTVGGGVGANAGGGGGLPNGGGGSAAGGGSGKPTGGGSNGTVGGGTGNPTGGGSATCTASACVAQQLGTSCNNDNECVCGGVVCDPGMACQQGACVPRCHEFSNDDGMPFIMCVGWSGAQLGASVSMCGPGAFVAGAPGTSQLFGYVRGDAGWATVDDPNGGYGTAVLCRATAPLLGGSAGLVSVDGGGWTPWSLKETFALTSARTITGVTGGAFFATGTHHDVGGRALFRSADNGELVLIDSNTDEERFGAAVASGPGYVVVGSPRADDGVVRIYSGDPLTLSKQLPVPYAQGGVALAVGDVIAESGNEPVEELIVASLTKLVIFRNGAIVGGVALPTGVDSSSDRPAVSLAIETRPIVPGGHVRAWWYGIPSLNLVRRCVGDFCDDAAKPLVADVALGASLSTSGASLVVGAPNYVPATKQGAVVLVDLDRVDAGDIAGEEQPCGQSYSACCTSALAQGVCVGRTYCLTGANASPSAACQPDAGVDGGSGDTDGGVTEPGPAQFATCGCTSANGALAMLGLAALFLRRRR